MRYQYRKRCVAMRRIVRTVMPLRRSCRGVSVFDEEGSSWALIVPIPVLHDVGNRLITAENCESTPLSTFLAVVTSWRARYHCPRLRASKVFRNFRRLVSVLLLVLTLPDSTRTQSIDQVVDERSHGFSKVRFTSSSILFTFFHRPAFFSFKHQ